MKQIRRNVFETNSSSSHSLVITTIEGKYSKEEMERNIYLRSRGQYEMDENDLIFERSPFEILGTFESKTRYACASSRGRLVPQLEAIWKKYIHGFTSFNFQEKFKVWDKKKKEYVFPKEPEYEYGHTDDSQLEGWLKEYNISLEDFLTMKRYIVIVDGDESRVWYKLIDSGLIDTSIITHDSEKEYQEYLKEWYAKERLKNHET